MTRIYQCEPVVVLGNENEILCTRVDKQVDPVFRTPRRRGEVLDKVVVYDVRAIRREVMVPNGRLVIRRW
jgi:hypothetical protein